MQSYFNLSRNLSNKKATLPALVCLALGTLLAGSVHADGTPVSTPVQNSVTLSYQVNSVNQTASTSVTFNVDRKLVLDVTTTDTDWVPVVPSQDVTTAGAALPALNFTVTNSSNDLTNVVLGLIDQDGNAVTGFTTPGSAFASTPGAVVVAIDDGGTPGSPVSDGVYTQGVDTVLTVGANGVYSLGSLPIDGTANVLVAISVDGAEANNVYRSYTLVAGVADAGGAPFTPSSLDDSGNIAPGSGATPTEVANGLTTIETVWADAGAPAANADDEQFDFFSAASGLNAIDGIADGQSSDASGFTTRVALSLAKNAVVLYDPITGNRFSDRDTEDAEPKAIPGAVIMYVIGVANESATLAANAVTLNDVLPTEVTAGDQANPAAAIVIPNAASFAVGGLTPSFDLSTVTDLDVVSHLECSTPASAPAYTGAPITGVGGDLGNCAAGAIAYIVYFVTLD